MMKHKDSDSIWYSRSFYEEDDWDKPDYLDKQCRPSIEKNHYDYFDKDGLYYDQGRCRWCECEIKDDECECPIRR